VQDPKILVLRVDPHGDRYMAARRVRHQVPRAREAHVTASRAGLTDAAVDGGTLEAKSGRQRHAVKPYKRMMAAACRPCSSPRPSTTLVTPLIQDNHDWDFSARARRREPPLASSRSRIFALASASPGTARRLTAR